MTVARGHQPRATTPHQDASPLAQAAYNLGDHMTAAICDLCARPVDGTAYACTTCATTAGEQLHTIAELTPHARHAAAGQARRATGSGRSRTIRLELDLSAASRLDAVQTHLTGWARTVLEERGGALPDGTDPIVVSARYLAGHVEWLRHQRHAAEALRDIGACVRLVRAIVDGPGERTWLGQCGAGEPRCPQDLRVRVGAVRVTCPACGAVHDVAERRRWLDETALDYSYTAAEIAAACGIRAGTIRVWAHRGRVVATGSVGGQPVYPLRQVLVLAGRSREVAA